MRIDRIEVGDGPVTTIEFDKVTTTEVDALRFKTKDLVLTGGIIANGSIGSNGQVLVSNELGELYWTDSSTLVSQRFIADGVTDTFTITGGYLPSSVMVFLNGVKQNSDTDVDISSGTDIVFTTPPSSGFNIDVFGYQAQFLSGVTSITAGDGLTGGSITSIGNISIDAKDGLIANSSGLFLLANSGLTTNSSGVFVVANNGLSSNSSGLFIVTGSGIEPNSPTISILANSGLIANSAGVFVLANSGINSNSSGVFVVANNGLTVNSTGVFVLANSGIVANSTGVFVFANNGIVSNTTGVFVVANNGLVSNSTGVFALANSGLTVNSTGLFVLANSGIVSNTTGTYVLANSGLTTNSTGLFVLANSGIVSNTTGTYVLANSGIVSNSTGVFALANSGLTANSTGLFVLANTGIISNTSGVFSNTTFSGNSSTIAATFVNIAESVNVSATAATGTISYYLASQSVLYYTTSASGNWTPNVAYSATTSLNTAMTIGQAVTLSFLVTQGGTAYFANTINIDGVAVPPKWTNGTIPTAGNINSVDTYTYTIIKTGAATFTVLANLTQYK